jgi:hypothetical protein
MISLASHSTVALDIHVIRSCTIGHPRHLKMMKMKMMMMMMMMMMDDDSALIAGSAL